MDCDRDTELERKPSKEITVGANKGCSFYFKLARRMLMNEEACDLTALEGAIVFAVDTAFLLERTMHAKITRVQTSYVVVPKRRNRDDDFELTDTSIRSDHQQESDNEHQQITGTAVEDSTEIGESSVHYKDESHAIGSKAPSTQLRRARITITVQRTENYSRWLNENAHHVHDEAYDDQVNM